MTIRMGIDDVESASALITEWINEARSAVVFTGAGISTESGIPDFRSPGGVWLQNQPVYFDDFMANSEARYEYWRQKAIAHRDFEKARPNITHRAIASWESSGRLRGVITQNIDGLHQDAGNEAVLELHGTVRDIACMDCDWREPADRWVKEFLANDAVPDCPNCAKIVANNGPSHEAVGQDVPPADADMSRLDSPARTYAAGVSKGRLKHATISFGQPLEPGVLQKAASWSATSDLFFAIGSSLVVQPAAGLPQLAKDNGAKLVILNRESTPLDARADLVVNCPLGELFNRLSR